MSALFDRVRRLFSGGNSKGLDARIRSVGKADELAKSKDPTKWQTPPTPPSAPGGF
jgi:hypothetical protein